MLLLSVVIPYYQVASYIEACLSRVAKLPQEICEILLVDDCGKDESAEIAATYCANYPHMRMIKREKNGGLSAARNTGLAEAKGEYVYFLDSDDLPEADALMQVVSEAKVQGLDVAKARFVYMDDLTEKETAGPAIEQTDVIPGSVMLARQCREGLYEPMVWQCVYRRAFLQDNHFQMAEGLLFEDELFQAPVLLKAKRTAVFEQVILRYRQREGSIMRSFTRDARWCESYLSVCRKLEKIIQPLEENEAKQAMRRRIGQIALSLGKNIPAYHLPENVAQEARAFLHANHKEISRYAKQSGDWFVQAQGVLLGVSVQLFLSVYKHLSRG